MAASITVLLPFHNEERFLPEAVESILGQTFHHFELLLIDDGSTDKSAAYLATLRDPRMRIIRNSVNLGLTHSLNLGLEMAAGRYIARMDADDTSLPERLQRQFDFLETHSDVGIVGTSRLLIDEEGNFVAEARAVPDDLGIRWKCLLGNPFAHPTVMMRASVLRQHNLHYRECRRAEDYELWPRLLALTRGANLSEPLLKYRLRKRNALSHTEQLRNHDDIAFAAIRTLLPNLRITLDELTGLRGRFGGFSVRDPGMNPEDADWIGRYLNMLDEFARTYATEPDIGAFVHRQRASVRPRERLAS